MPSGMTWNGWEWLHEWSGMALGATLGMAENGSGNDWEWPPGMAPGMALGKTRNGSGKDGISLGVTGTWSRSHSRNGSGNRPRNDWE